MASNTQSVSGDVLYQGGDDLSETNLTKTAAKSNLTDYVERGLGFSVDHGANEVTIGSGHAIIQDGAAAYDVFPDQTTLSLPATSGTNYVFLTHDPASDNSISYHIDDADTAPSNPSLKIGTVDTANDTSDDTINRDPDGSFETVSIERAAINDVASVIEVTSQFDIPTGTWTQTQYGGIKKEDSNILDVNLSNDEIVVQVDGFYLIIYQAAWRDISSTNIRARVNINGSEDLINQMGESTWDFPGLPVIPGIDLTAGDSITTNIYHEDGTTRQANNSSHRLTVARLG